ncbi:hypothetical protein AAMO2058_000658600 [Amorphochlora amoebiformis]
MDSLPGQCKSTVQRTWKSTRLHLDSKLKDDNKENGGGVMNIPFRVKKRKAQDFGRTITLLSSVDEEKNAEVLSNAEVLDKDIGAFHENVLSVLFPRLDELMGGGIFSGEVLELVGESAVGKTQMCLMIAARLVAYTNSYVAYIDTSSSFAPNRVQQIYQDAAQHVLRVQTSQSPQNWAGDGLDPKPKDFKIAFRQIRVFKVSNAFELNTVLEEIRKGLSQVKVNFSTSSLSHIFCQLHCSLHQDKKYDNLQMIIIDSLSAVLSPHLGGNEYQGFALMSETSRAIKHIVHKHNIAAITTSHTVSNRVDGLKPALGESWTYFADKRLSLYFHPRDKSRRIIAMTKSNCTEIGGACECRISERGIIDASGKDASECPQSLKLRESATHSINTEDEFGIGGET